MYIHFNYHQKPCISLNISKDQFGVAAVTYRLLFSPSFGFPLPLHSLQTLDSAFSMVVFFLHHDSPNGNSPSPVLSKVPHTQRRVYGQLHPNVEPEERFIPANNLSTRHAYPPKPSAILSERILCSFSTQVPLASCHVVRFAFIPLISWNQSFVIS